MEIAAFFISIAPLLFIALTTRFHDSYHMPKKARTYSQFIKPASAIYLGVLLIHYIVNGIDWSLLPAFAFFTLISSYVVMQKRHEANMLTTHPHEDLHISNKAINFLYWSIPALMIASFMLGMKVLQ